MGDELPRRWSVKFRDGACPAQQIYFDSPQGAHIDGETLNVALSQEYRAVSQVIPITGNTGSPRRIRVYNSDLSVVHLS